MTNTNTKNGTIITNASIQGIGERIALKALNTIYQRSGQAYIYTLYKQLIQGINILKGNSNDILQDGYDIAQEAIFALCDYRGYDLNAIIAKNKAGRPITVLRAVFKKVNSYIMQKRTFDFKKVYLQDLDNNKYYVIPKYWDIPTINDFKKVTYKINKMDLTDRQQQILNLRLQGLNDCQTAKKLNVSQQAINKTRKQIAVKYNNL